MTSELHFLTIAEAAELIRARKLSPFEYTEALLQRIDWNRETDLSLHRRSVTGRLPVHRPRHRYPSGKGSISFW